MENPMPLWYNECAERENGKRKKQVSGQTDSRKYREWNLEK